MVEGEIKEVIAKINSLAAEKLEEGLKVGIIGTEETVECYPAGDVKSIGTREDEATIAEASMASCGNLTMTALIISTVRHLPQEGLGARL